MQNKKKMSRNLGKKKKKKEKRRLVELGGRTDL